MLSRISLKYRIALVIFCLELLMMTTVLWQTLSSSLESTRKLHAENDKVMLQLLADLSSTALLTEELSDVQLYFQQVLQQPTVKHVLLTDLTNRVVASSNIADVGNPLPVLNDSEDRYWRSQPVASAAGDLGLLAIEFSNEAIVAANTQARNLGVTIAIIGMSIILVIGLIVGYALTHRLDLITGAARGFAEGNYNAHSGVSGRDELGALGLTFDQMVHDVSQKQRQLSEQSAHIRLLMDSTAEAIYGIDLDGVCVFVNPACLAMLGFENETQLLGKPLNEIVHFRDADDITYDKTFCPGINTIKTALPTHSDNSVIRRRADGSEIFVEYWAHVMRRENRMEGAVVTFVDISEHKRAEQELKKHRENLEELVALRTTTVKEQALILSQIHDAVVSTDLDGVVTSWNQGAERMFGYTANEALGQHISFAYPPEEHTKLATQVIAPLKAKSNHEIEVTVRRKNGENFFGHLSLSMLIDDNNKPKGMVGYMIDITEKKNAEDLAEKHANELATLNRELESFSYSVSHDLRAPLRSIDGFSQALLEDYADKLNDTGVDYLRRVRAGAQRMARLIDDLLKLSRMTRSKMNLEEVDLSKLAQEVVDNLRQNEPKRHVDIDIQPGLHAYADLGLIRVVLENLLGNAWKYSGNQTIAQIKFGTQQQDQQTAYFVHDNGVGFDMQHADKLFGAFQRLHRADQFEGNGIGLATVQRIIHRHGGTIWAQSEPDKGATFYFTLTAAA